MADEATLAALFGGGSTASSRIPGDLDQFQRTVSANDIFKLAANQIGGYKPDSSTWSPATKIGTTAAQAFISALLGSYAQGQEAKQLAAVNAVLPDLYSNPSGVAAPEGVDSQAFQQLRANKIYDYESRQRDEALSRQRSAQSTYDRIAAEVFTRDPELGKKFLVDQNPNLKDILQPEEQQVPLESADALRDTTGLSSGRESSAERLLRLTQEFSKVMPRAQAAVSARQQIQDQIAANKSSFDTAKSSREYGDKLLQLAQDAEIGISKAGSTGTLPGIAHAYEAVKAFAGDDTARTKVEGDQLLNALGPQLINMGKSPGAVSDYESRSLMASGPSTSNYPETNVLMKDRLKVLGKEHLDYADFIDAYKLVNDGNVSGADVKWSQYKQQNPLVIDVGGKPELNTTRKDWRQFFAEQGAGQLSGSSASMGMPQVNVDAARQEAIALASQGKSKLEIANILRSKYGGR